MWSVRLESLLVATSLLWAIGFNRALFTAALRGHDFGHTATWSLALGLLLVLLAIHVLLLGAVSTRRSAKPVIALLTLVGAFAMHYMSAFGVVLDPSMVRNALHTDVAETRELLSWGLAADLLLYAGAPLALLWAVRIEPRPWRSALRQRALLLAGALAALVLALLWQFQSMASLVRNHKEVRYLVTPANSLWSLGAVLAADARGAAQPRQAIGLDAKLGAAPERARLVVLVVGETARAANWGLSGYARQTTPRLAQTDAINFAEVTACGTSTEASLPCLFAPVGRRDYDEARIRGSESLLHVAARAGVAVQWIDNQSGCKGVCAGLPAQTVTAATAPGLCEGERCWDEALLRGLDERLRSAAAGRGTQLLVLHMLGNHGPSYWRRYPSAFERFTPACRDDDLSHCTREQIVNAYDNALLYTDHVLASLIGTLRAHAGTVDSAMLYVSDHGESLGEKGLFLHGVPWSIAPSEQTRVPMVLWWSQGFGASARLDDGCVRERARQPAQHDHLFHTLLSLLDVRTALRDSAWDLTQGCHHGSAG